MQTLSIDAELPAAGAVRARLSYLAPGDARPVSYAFPPPEGEPWENRDYVQREVFVHDGREHAPPSHIDREGFELRDAPTALADFRSEAVIKAAYYPEVAELALAVTGARHAFVFDHLVRRREADRAALSFGRAAGKGAPAAANGRIHNDYTEASGRARLLRVLGDVDAAARVRRYAIVNVWRSIKGPIVDTPLAVCDARTVMARDLVEGEVRYPRRVGEIYLANPSPQHRWTYYSRMDRHEALVFKQYDAQLAGVARFTPHAAFDHPGMPPGAPLRESIEARCLVVYD